MSEAVRTDEFDQLIADGWPETVLDDFELDFGDLLTSFNPFLLLSGFGLDLSVEELSETWIGLLGEPFSFFGGGGDEGFYAITIEGTGFSPLGGGEAFEDALIEGEAAGQIESITIDHFPGLEWQEDEDGVDQFPDSTFLDDTDIVYQTILEMEMSSAGYSIVSGNQALEITGTLPDSFEQFGEILLGLDAFVMSQLDAREDPDQDPDFALLDDLFDGFRIDSLNLADGGATLLTATFTEDALEIEVDGYRIVFCDFDFNLATFFGAFGAFEDDEELLWPELALYNERGELMPMFSDAGLVSVGGFDNTASLTFNVTEEGVGTYFIEVGADPEGPLSTGFYQLIEGGFFFFEEDIPEEDYERIFEDPDAPADITTPYVLPLGDLMVTEPAGDFLGQINPEGDTDWIRVDINESGFYSFRAFGIPDDPDDLNLDALFTFFGVTCVEVYNPGGDLIARADDPESLFGPPPIPGPGDDDDDDDDDNGQPGDDGPVVFPPLPPGPAWGLGDPHLMTLDGVGYDFHAAGEYVMTRATDGSDFEVQARMAPVGENVTANVAAAVQLDGGSVMVDAMGPDPLRVNGEAVTIEDGGFIELGGDRVYFNAGTNSYLMVHTGDGDMDTGYSAVQVIVGPQWVDIIVGLDDAWAGTVEGLLGNFDGNPDNDIALPDGSVLDRPLTFDDLYGDYRDAWRVSTEEQSLFAYAEGEGPDSFYLPDYPTAMVSVADFSQEAQAAAAAQLEAAGLAPDTVAFNNALLDLLLTGDDRFIGSGQTAQETEETRPEEAPPPVVPETDGGGLDGLVTLSGRLVDPGGEGLNGATVTFQPAGRSVALTRNTREGDEFGFDLMPSETGGRLEATRDYDQSVDGRPTATDALEVLRMAVGLTPGFGAATPEAFIAADMNRDGQINAQDALEVLRAAVGLDSPNAPQWVFVDAGADLSETVTGRNAVAYETGVQIAGFEGDLSGLDMKGILLGDMSAF